MTVTTRHVTLHGYRTNYVRYVPDPDKRAQATKRRRRRSDAATDTDPVVLIHGIAGSGESWRSVITELADRGFQREVIAPDLLGHGQSAKPAADYSAGMFATGVRDLLAKLGHRRATVVGHSLGGTVAMQVAYQHPELCGRLVLVSSGGLGRDIWPLVRAANLPGAEMALSLLTNPAVVSIGSMLAGLRGDWSAEDRELASCFASLADPHKRAAYMRTARSSTTLSGQRTAATNRMHLAEFAPSLIVWGADDRVIPVSHGRRAAKLMPGSTLEVMADAGHFPHVADPHRFTGLLVNFINTTRPARWNPERLTPYLTARTGLDSTRLGA